MKKSLKFTFLISAGLILAGCTLPNSNNNFDLNIIAKDTIAVQATTALTLSHSFGDLLPMQQLEDELSIVNAPDTEIPIATLDFFFNHGGGFNITKTTSDRDDYVYLDVISFHLSEDVNVTYKLYYNLETAEKELIEPDEIDEFDSEDSEQQNKQTVYSRAQAQGGGNHGNKDADGKGERKRHRHGNGNRDGDKKQFGKGQHQHYRLSGLALVGEEEYHFVVKTQNKNNSAQLDKTLKFRLYQDADNYIVIKQGSETISVPGEANYEYVESFSYIVVENNEVVKQFKHEFVQDQDEFVLTLIIDGVKYIVESYTIDEQVFLEITLCGGETFVYEKVITTDIETGITTIVYVLQ